MTYPKHNQQHVLRNVRNLALTGLNLVTSPANVVDAGAGGDVYPGLAQMAINDGAYAYCILRMRLNIVGGAGTIDGRFRIWIGFIDTSVTPANVIAAPWRNPYPSALGVAGPAYTGVSGAQPSDSISMLEGNQALTRFGITSLAPWPTTLATLEPDAVARQVRSITVPCYGLSVGAVLASVEGGAGGNAITAVNWLWDALYT